MNWGRSPNRGRKAPENRKRSLRLSGEDSVSPSPEFFLNSYLKPCILVYSWNEKSIFSPSGSRNFPEMKTRYQVSAWERCKTTNNWISDEASAIYITNDFDTFQSNAYFGVEESPFSKTCTSVMVQINRSLRAVAQIWREVSTVWYHQIIYSVGPPILDPILKQHGREAL